MFTAILVVHVVVSVLLVMVVLLQSGRGAELGAAFGSVGQATFGRGRPTFLSKFTTSMAVIFMSTSLALAFLSNEQPRQSVVAPSGSEASAPASLEPVPLPLPRSESEQQAAQPGTQSAPAAPQAAGEPAPLQQTDAPPQEQK